MDSCNGLVLFWHTRSDTYATELGYIVCNPATEEWVSVPRSCWSWCDGGEDCDIKRMRTITRLIFDPVVSSQFELVHFLICTDGSAQPAQVHTYSSESRAWSSRATECWSDEAINTSVDFAFVHGMIHLYGRRQNVIVGVDGRGEKRRIIRWPKEERGSLVFIGESQGLLHCTSAHGELIDDMIELSIWVLEGYGMEQWILKDSVNCMQLFGGEEKWGLAYATVTIHPDRSLAFFFHLKNKKLVSYDMDSKEVSALCTLEGGWIPMNPYFPYFGESSGSLRNVDIAGYGILLRRFQKESYILIFQ